MFGAAFDFFHAAPILKAHGPLDLRPSRVRDHAHLANLLRSVLRSGTPAEVS